MGDWECELGVGVAHRNLKQGGQCGLADKTAGAKPPGLPGVHV